MDGLEPLLRPCVQLQARNASQTALQSMHREFAANKNSELLNRDYCIKLPGPVSSTIRQLLPLLPKPS